MPNSHASALTYLTEIVPRPPGGEERLLQQVLGEGAVAHHVDEELAEPAFVLLEQPLDVGAGRPVLALHDVDHAR